MSTPPRSLGFLSQTPEQVGTTAVTFKPVVKFPTGRTFKKAARDASLALLGFAAAYTVAHQADFGITPEVAAIIGPAAIAIYRTVRGMLGAEPATP